MTDRYCSHCGGEKHHKVLYDNMHQHFPVRPGHHHCGCKKHTPEKHHHYINHKEHCCNHHKHDYDFHHHHGHHHYDHCNRFICDDDFRLRLGGLQGGLNFRLRQMIGSVVEMELEGSKKILAEVCFVGSNFVEVKVLKEEEVPETEPPADEIAEELEEEMEDEEVEVDDEDEEEAEAEVEEKDMVDTKPNKKKKKHPYSLISPLDHIKYIKFRRNPKCKHCD